jgi:hypothetical protein
MGSSTFYFYVHKYVYFIVIVQNRLGRLTPFKHRLNSLNAKYVWVIAHFIFMYINMYILLLLCKTI